jgi:hypothetical protein
MTAVLANPKKAAISGTFVIAHGFDKFAFLSIAFLLSVSGPFGPMQENMKLRRCFDVAQNQRAGLFSPTSGFRYPRCRTMSAMRTKLDRLAACILVMRLAL